VTPAPAAALTAAIIAMVVFDIVRVCGRTRQYLLCWRFGARMITIET
jgi:hypothetical protein